jgi:glyoxylase-like metal-dependent hydrolase (beta-lactamase superfamily II)
MHRQSFDRRAVLAGLVGAAAVAFRASRLAAQPRAADIAEIGDRLSVVTGLGGNIVVYAATAGAILVDSGAADATNALSGVLDRLPGPSTVRTLFNTHWHLDQVGGNSAVRARGADIVAHQKTWAHLATPYYLPEEDRYQPAEAAEAHPTHRFFDGGVIDSGDEAIRYGYLLEAHTDGDIYVKFEASNVIAAGDAISPLRDPELDWFGGGWLGGRVDSLALLLDVSDADTRFVPSYGPVVDRAYVQSEHALMLGLFDILWERVRAGESAADIHASGALDTLDRRFADPMKLLYDAHKSMWAHYNTLSPDIV